MGRGEQRSYWFLKSLVWREFPFCGMQGCICVILVDQEGISILGLWFLPIGWKRLVCHVSACHYVHLSVTLRWPAGHSTFWPQRRVLELQQNLAWSITHTHTHTSNWDLRHKNLYSFIVYFKFTFTDLINYHNLSFLNEGNSLILHAHILVYCE